MKTVFLAFCLFLSLPVWSQTVGVEVLVTTNRMLSRLDELEELANSSQLIIRIRNSTPLRQNIQLEMSLTSLQTQFSIHTNRNAAPSFFSVNAFDTRTLDVSDLSELFDQNSFGLGDGRTLAEFLAEDPTGQVPSGQYRLCVRVVPQSLTPPQPTSYQGEGCTTITFQQFNPPVISLINNYPYSEGFTVSPLRNPNVPFFITFTPPISALTNPIDVRFNYTLYVVELFENDQRDPNQVLQAVIDGKEPRGIVVRKEILNSPAGQPQITANLLPVDFSAPLQLAHNYAVAVLAELQGTTTAELPNGGLSPICSFQYGQRTVVNRPLTGRYGIDVFIRILNSLDAPDKSTQELYDQALAELGRRTVVMKANKTCYSSPSAVLCVKLDSLYDVNYPNRGINNLMKLVTNDLADDLADGFRAGDAFNVCLSGGSVRGFNLQRVGGLTAGLSAFMQRPSAQNITDRMTSVCGESFGAGGGKNTDANSECTDCQIDPVLGDVLEHGSIDQLNPYVQYVNELFAGCSTSGTGGIPDSGNNPIKNPDGNTSEDTSHNSETEDKIQNDKDLLSDIGDVFINVGAATGAAMTGDVRGVITAGADVASAFLGNEMNVESESIRDGANVVGHFLWMEGVLGTAAIIVGTGVAGATVGTFALVGLGLAGAANGGYQFVRGLEEEQRAKEERVKRANEEGVKRTGNTNLLKLTLDDPSSSVAKQIEKIYELKKRFGRLGWEEAFGSGGSSINTNGTVVSSGLQAGKELTGFACRMVDKCNQDGWGSTECRGFLNSFNCKGDSRLIYMDPNAFAGCGAPPYKNKYGCEEKMVGNPAPGSENNDPCAKIEANRAILSKILAKGRDPRFTDPVDPNSGIDIPTGGGKKGPGPDPHLNPQSTNNPQPVLGGQSSPTIPTNTIPKPTRDKPSVPKPNATKKNNSPQNPDPNKNHSNR